MSRPSVSPRHVRTIKSLQDPHNAERLPQRKGDAIGVPHFCVAPTPAAYFGRTASAVPWMKALIASISSNDSLPVKSGMPRSVAGPLRIILSRFSM